MKTERLKWRPSYYYGTQFDRDVFKNLRRKKYLRVTIAAGWVFFVFAVVVFVALPDKSLGATAGRCDGIKDSADGAVRVECVRMVRMFDRKRKKEKRTAPRGNAHSRRSLYLRREGSEKKNEPKQ